MTKLHTITGEIVQAGHIQPDDLAQYAQSPSITLRTQDNRLIVVTGLTRDECRAWAEGFAETVTVSVERVAQ